MLQMPDGNTTVILQGKKRFILKDEVQSEPYIKATVEPFKEIKPKEDKEFKAMVSSVKDMAMNIIQLSPNIPSEAGIAIRNIESTNFLDQLHIIKYECGYGGQAKPAGNRQPARQDKHGAGTPDFRPPDAGAEKPDPNQGTG
jgi:hypothetical protein